MFLHSDFGPIIETGPPDRFVIKAKASDTYNMKRHSGSGAQSGDVAGVWRNLRL